MIQDANVIQIFKVLINVMEEAHAINLLKIKKIIFVRVMVILGIYAKYHRLIMGSCKILFRM